MTQELIDELQAMLEAEEKEVDGYENLMVALHHYAPALLDAARENLRLRHVIWRVLDELPARKDWLDPQLEAEMKALGKETV